MFKLNFECERLIGLILALMFLFKLNLNGRDLLVLAYFSGTFEVKFECKRIVNLMSLMRSHLN